MLPLTPCVRGLLLRTAMALSISQWERQTLLVKAMGSPATWLISLQPPLVRGSYIVRSVPLVEVGPLRQLPAPPHRTIRSHLAAILTEIRFAVDAPPIPHWSPTPILLDL